MKNSREVGCPFYKVSSGRRTVTQEHLPRKPELFKA